MSAEIEPRMIEEYLHRRIPIAAAMDVHVESANSRCVRLSAPFGPNINAETVEYPEPARRSTSRTAPVAARGVVRSAAPEDVVFGGSAVTVAILAAWTLLYVRELSARIPARLVIQRGTIHYERPITGEFEAVCALEDERAYDRFRKTFERRGRSRITLRSTLLQSGRRAGSFEGDFVALPRV